MGAGDGNASGSQRMSTESPFTLNLHWPITIIICSRNHIYTYKNGICNVHFIYLQTIFSNSEAEYFQFNFHMLNISTLFSIFGIIRAREGNLPLVTMICVAERYVVYCCFLKYKYVILLEHFIISRQRSQRSKLTKFISITDLQ